MRAPQRPVLAATLVALSGSLAVTAPAPAVAATTRQFVPAVAMLEPEGGKSQHLAIPTAPQAIALLNKQRSANGIPGDLVEEPSLSNGCLSWATSYRPAKYQYPHEEIPSQPGYTPGGNEAAARSALAGEAGGGSWLGTLWSSTFNPWSASGLHETKLMDPSATTAWYGGSKSAACMGADGQRPFVSAALFSVPGPGSVDVPIVAHTGELPYSPQTVVGLGRDAYVAPAIIVWAKGADAKLQTATLRTIAGASVPISLVTPQSPAPPAAGNFPSFPTLASYTDASYVVPRVRFSRNTSYVLSAVWQAPSGTIHQTSSFRTAAAGFDEEIAAAEETAALGGVEPGAFTPVLKGRTLTITATGLAVGRTVSVRMLRCPVRLCAERPYEVFLRRTLTLATTPISLRIPRTRAGKATVLYLAMPEFRVSGRTIVAAEPELRLSRHYPPRRWRIGRTPPIVRRPVS